MSAGERGDNLVLWLDGPYAARGDRGERILAGVEMDRFVLAETEREILYAVRCISGWWKKLLQRASFPLRPRRHNV